MEQLVADALLTPAEVAAVLDISQRRAWAILREVGVLVGPRTLRVEKARLQEWIEDHRLGGDLDGKDIDLLLGSLDVVAASVGAER